MKSILICCMVLFVASSAFSQKNKQVEQLVDAYDKAGKFSGTILVAEKGKIIFEKSYGYKNGPKKEKNTNNSLQNFFHHKNVHSHGDFEIGRRRQIIDQR